MSTQITDSVYHKLNVFEFWQYWLNSSMLITSYFEYENTHFKSHYEVFLLSHDDL